MKTRSLIVGATLATFFATSAFATAHADALTTMTVDDNAPIRATLLPTVSIDPTQRMRVADTAPYEVTLLPTVHVKARANPELAVTLLPTVYVTAESGDASTLSEPVADVEDIARQIRAGDDESPREVKRPFGLRSHTMPR
jgi:hypothetical protein